MPNNWLGVLTQVCPRLFLVDSCTGYTIVYPSTSLQANTVRNHLHMYLCSHPIPSEINSDLGSEFRKGLDVFLAKYNISLSASKPYSKGSSSNAESAIRLVKSALRQLCMTLTAASLGARCKRHWTLWYDHLSIQPLFQSIQFYSWTASWCHKIFFTNISANWNKSSKDDNITFLRSKF